MSSSALSWKSGLPGLDVVAESSCSSDEASEAQSCGLGGGSWFPSRPKYSPSSYCRRTTSSGVAEVSSQSEDKEKFVAGVDESDRSADSVCGICGDDRSEEPDDPDQVPGGW